MGKLTEKAIRAIKTDGRHGDGGGLYLVKRGGSTAWHLRWMRAGRAREMSLGSYPEISLSMARERALEGRRAIREGKDPIAAKATERGLEGHTFAKVAKDYIATHQAGWRNPKHAAQWSSTLEAYVYPTIGRLPISAITTDHVVRILRPIWESKTETASRVRGRVEAVLDYAKARGWRAGENPAAWRGHLDHILPARSKVARVQHHAAVPWRDLPAVMLRLADSEGMSARCLRFATLTASRSSEARGARWSEIDLEASLWTIPDSRMKAGKDHRVPLSPEAIAILTPLREVSAGPDALVFPGGREGRPLSDVALAKALAAAAGEGFTVHGMRSAFRDWAAEATNYPREIAEAALAHTNKDKVEAAYLRGDHLDKRRRLMADWAGFLSRPMSAGEIVPIRAAG